MAKKKWIILMILCLEFFLGLIGVLVMMNSVDKKADENTTEFVATITEIDIKNVGEDISIEIGIEEYESLLYISSSIGEKIDMDHISDLQKGQTIFFRIEDNMLEQFGEVSFCNIVALRTTETEIISLSNYNAYMHEAAFPARIAGGVVAGIFLSGFIYFALRLKRLS